MLWHDGYDLSQTIFTCLYALHLDQQSLWAASDSSQEQDQESEADPKLTSLVLYAYLLAVCKGIDLTMQEYARGNVLEVRPSLAPIIARALLYPCLNSKMTCPRTKTASLSPKRCLSKPQHSNSTMLSTGFYPSLSPLKIPFLLLFSDDCKCARYVLLVTLIKARLTSGLPGIPRRTGFDNRWHARRQREAQACPYAHRCYTDVS